MKKHHAIIARNAILNAIGTLITFISSIACHNAFASVIVETSVAFQGTPWLYIVRLFPAIACILLSILVFYYLDNLDLFNKRDYYHNKDRKALIKEPQYLVGFIVGLVFSASFFATPLDFFISFFIPGSILISRILSVLIYSAIRLIQLSLLKSKWDLEFESPIFVQKTAFKRNRDFKNFRMRQLFLQPLGFFALYFLVIAIANKWLVPIIISIVIMIVDRVWGLFAIIFLIILLSLAVSVINGLRARRKLLSRLKKLEKLGYAKIKYDGSKYLSALFPKRMFSFELEDSKGKKYNTVVISCGKMNSPIYFREDEFLIERSVRLNNGALISRGGAYAQIVDVSKMGGDQNPTNALAGYYIVLPLDFPDSEGERTVIINPIPTRVFVMDNAKAKSIDTGERLFDYTVYNTTGFCNMIERDND